MTRNIYNYLVVAGAEQLYFEDFKSATKFINTFVDDSTYTRVYKLVYANGELVKDVKK